MKKSVSGALLSAALLAALTLPAGATGETTQISRAAFCNMAYQMLSDADKAPAAPATNPFRDTSDPAVLALYQMGVVKGTSDTTFEPNAFLTRQEAATFMDRMREKTGLAAAAAANNTYADDPAISDWAKDAAYTLRDLNIMIGTGENRFSPYDTLTEWQGRTLLTRLQAQALPEAITAISYQSALESVADQIRWAGTEGERLSAQELADAFAAWGYDVTKQAFQFTTMPQGGVQDSDQATNVIAVKKAGANATGDILVISAHHDSMPTTVGGNDNASGTAMLLELARALKDIDTDTEIRFVAFSAEEEGLKGSAYYTSQLTQEEKSHIIGDIQIDMIANYRTNQTTIKTTDGNMLYIGQLVQQAAKAVTGSEWKTGTVATSDHMSFVREGMPAILIEQDGLGVENHKADDRANVIDVKQAVPIAKTLSQTIRTIASTETKSLVKDAYASFRGADGATIDDHTRIFFGLPKNDIDVYVGASGTYEKTTVQAVTDWSMDHYIINAKWFGWDTALPTDFVYRKMDDGATTLVELYIRTASLGLTDAQLSERMTAIFGEPETTSDGHPIWGMDDQEKNLSLRRYELLTEDGVQALQILSAFHSQEGVDLATFDFTKPVSSYQGKVSPAEYTLIETIHKIIPSSDKYMKNIVSWTDGYSWMLGFCSADDPTKSDSFSIRIDRYDYFDDNGNLLDLDKLLTTMVHEYGHALTLNKDQVDVSKLDARVDYNDPTIYRDGAYLKAYYEKFYVSPRAFSDHPEDYVDEYGSGSMFEDIAETFMVFVLSDRPTDLTRISDQKIAFFYDYPEIVSVRNYVRSNFNFPS